MPRRLPFHRREPTNSDNEKCESAIIVGAGWWGGAWLFFPSNGIVDGINDLGKAKGHESVGVSIDRPSDQRQGGKRGECVAHF